jgi:hypothetical protein
MWSNIAENAHFSIMQAFTYKVACALKEIKFKQSVTNQFMQIYWLLHVPAFVRSRRQEIRKYTKKDKLIQPLKTIPL